jgi:hypothetical protein
MLITMAVCYSEVCILSPPVNWDRGVKSYWHMDVRLHFSCVVLFCTGRGIVMGNDGPIKGALPNTYKQDLFTCKMGDLGLHWPVSTTYGMVYILKLEYHYPMKLKYVVYLPVLKMVDDDNHHWHKLFKCTSTVCNVMLVHFCLFSWMNFVNLP